MHYLGRRLPALTLAMIGLALAALVAALVGGCAARSEPSPTVAPTQTTEPTATSQPTRTPTPPATDLPVPRQTSTPAPEAPDEGDDVEAEASSLVSGEIGSTAPELEGVSGWIQTDPFTIESLRGGVVLIDFWTYTCVNCIRTLPYLKSWYERYADLGFTIVGVHSPEFEFEKLRINVEKSIEEHGLEYPVVQDNEFSTWRAFENRAWPAKYLIDKDGIIRYTHFGEGAYDETEEQIRELLTEAGADVSDIVPGADPGPAPDSQAFQRDGTGQTRELYAGYERNFAVRGAYVANPEYYSAPIDSPSIYMPPDDYRNHFLYLNGSWTKGAESLTHGRQTDDLEDFIALRFHGTSVNVVTDFDDGEPIRVYLTINSQPVPEDARGFHVQLEDDGRTFFDINESRMYNLVRLQEYGGHDLKLSSDSDRFSVFAFTFGSYSDGP